MIHHETAANEALNPDHPSAPQPEALGPRFREARMRRGWDCDDVAARLKLPVRLIRCIETDDWAPFGAGLYLRSYLTRYAELVGVDAELLEPVLAQQEAPLPLVATGVTSRSRRMFNRYSVSATYLVLTALIVAPAVWLAANGGLEQGFSRTALLDDVAMLSTEAGQGGPKAVPTRPQPATLSPGPIEPLIASMAPFTSAGSTSTVPAPAPSADEPGDDAGIPLSLTLSEDSWVEILAADGSQLEYGLLRAGSRHEYRGDEPLSVRIGNASGVDIRMNGKLVDVTPFQRANVAHFSASPQRGVLDAPAG